MAGKLPVGSRAPAPPEEPLHERLLELAPLEGESPAMFLARAAGISAEYSEVQLSEEDLGAAQSLLPRWRLESDRRIRGKSYGLARQLARAMSGQRANLGEHSTTRRLVNVESDNIVLLAEQALNGSDLEVIFQIEQATTNGKTLSQQRLDARRMGYDAPEEAASETPEAEPARPAEPEATKPESKLTLNKVQSEVMWLLGWPTPRIARELKVSEETVRSRMTLAQQNNGGLQELLTAGLEEGRIDLSLLPERRDYLLTHLERKVLQEHPFSELAATAQALELTSSRAVSTIWTSIYKKTGISDELFLGEPVAPTRTRAFLITKHDGRIC